MENYRGYVLKTGKFESQRFIWNSRYSVTLVRFASYFFRSASKHDLFTELFMTLRLIYYKKQRWVNDFCSLFLFDSCYFQTLNTKLPFTPDPWSTMKKFALVLSKAGSIFLSKLNLSTLCHHCFIQSCSCFRLRGAMYKT